MHGYLPTRVDIVERRFSWSKGVVMLHSRLARLPTRLARPSSADAISRQ